MRFLLRLRTHAQRGARTHIQDEIQRELRRQVREQVDAQLREHVAVTLPEQAAESKRQLVEVKHALMNSCVSRALAARVC